MAESLADKGLLKRVAVCPCADMGIPLIMHGYEITEAGRDAIARAPAKLREAATARA